MKSFYILLAFLCPVFYTQAQTLVINEFMAANGTTIADEEGEYPDWLEIYNPGSAPVNMGGFALSDDSTRLNKWIFPQLTLAPQQFLFLFASGKDRRAFANHWETVINWGDIWKYRLGSAQIPADWNSLSYDDTGWSSGPSGFGYGDGDDSTLVPATLSLYLRKRFQVSDPNQVLSALLNVDYDDAFVAYLNGIEIARANIGQVGIPPAFNHTALQPREALIYQGGLPESFPLPDLSSLLLAGENVLAIQVHNYNLSSSDLSLIPFLTLGLDHVPPNPQGVHPLLTSSIPRLHTNFRIDAQGEWLILSNGSQQILDSTFSGTMRPDISRGRQPDGTAQWLYFNEATPGSSNITVGYAGMVDEPVFSLPAGFYSAPISLLITTASPGPVIRYTIDGSEPQETSPIFQQPLAITQNRVVRARAFAAGLLPSRSITATYFMNATTTLPVISLSTNPANLWDYYNGIYVMGPNADPNFPHFGANFWQDWEKPIHLEFFEASGQPGFSLDCGVKIFGGWSRGFPQKSLALFARGQYGYPEIAYQIFPDKPISSFQSLILRNSGNDWNVTHFRDALMTALIDDTGIDIQAYRPAVVYLNGEYWGIHNIREKIDVNFLATNHQINPGNIDLLENDRQVINGDAEHYQQMLDFISTHSLSDPGNFAQVSGMMDIQNFIDYQVSQIYYANTDWPGNNLRYWRHRSAEGKWKWIMFDTDFGFGLYDAQGYAHNTLEFATDPNGPGWPNPPWSTFLLRRLLDNPAFTIQFINRFADFMNSRFLYGEILIKIDEIRLLLQPEITRHMSRWGGSVTDWNNNIQRLQNFANFRPAYTRLHIINKFNLSGTARLEIRVSPEGSGKIRVNSLIPDSHPWAGIYFQNVPVLLQAIPHPGYRFTGWSGLPAGSGALVTLNLVQDLALTAQFEPDSSVSSIAVINEINYNSAPAFDPEDWLEIYNNSDQLLDLGDWEFKDSDDGHVYRFPSPTYLAAGQYLVLCRDTAAFKLLFPAVTNYLGNFGFGLSNAGDQVRLFDILGHIVDSLTYDDVPPWPVAPDGTGPTLSLKNPGLDNALPQSWAASAPYGTPGSINDVYISIDLNTPDALPLSHLLVQNYPNPFNPQTVIPFQLATAGHVRLEIFDVTGRRVQTLLDKKLPAGFYRIDWKPEIRMASGIYFYRLQTDFGFQAIKKMILLR